MTDDHLTALFAEGTAPERDAAFALRTDARIASERRALRVRTLAVRTLMILALAVTLFAVTRALEWALDQIDFSAPLFMGVPLPLVLVAIILSWVVTSRRFNRLRLS